MSVQARIAINQVNIPVGPVGAGFSEIKETWNLSGMFLGAAIGGIPAVLIGRMALFYYRIPAFKKGPFIITLSVLPLSLAFLTILFSFF